jgi:hypothetical protein
MSEKEIDPKDNKHKSAKKHKQEGIEQDKKEKKQYQETSKPVRFQFGHDATDEDIEKFLDMILGSEKNKNQEDEKH